MEVPRINQRRSQPLPKMDLVGNGDRRANGLNRISERSEPQEHSSNRVMLHRLNGRVKQDRQDRQATVSKETMGRPVLIHDYSSR